MNRLKKPLLILLVLALFTACILTLVGCGGEGGGLSAISVSTKSEHKKVYVQGQELSLDGGILTTVTDGKEAALPFTASGVSVTGYDPEKLGKQTLTVSYMDKTATFEIEVVARAVADGYEKDYFVKEKFDPLKGKIKITKDNGSTVNVTMSSRSVTLKSFDNTTAGTKTVTVTYTDESGTSYDCSFEVTVHEIANVTFTAPYKTAYKSHETVLDTAGGWLTVTAAAPSTLSKPVQITTDMISGFTPSLATSENIDTPLDQIVKITYGGKTFDFPITVLYSGVYVVEDAAEDLKTIDWSVADPIIDDRQATVAIKAMEAYFKLEDSEKSLVDTEKLHTVLRPAIVGLYGKYLNESMSFSDAFVISAQGSIDLTATSYDGVKNAIERLSDETDIFNAYASLAEKIRGEFGNFEIKEGVAVKNYLITHSPADVTELIKIYNFMLNISDKLKDVPDEWTIDTLKNYGDDIVTATTTIITSAYAGVNYRQLYFSVSSWRTNDDYIDIIYSYYYYIKEGGQDEIQKTLWGKIPAPGMLADWYSAFTSALQEEQTLEYYQSQAYLYDVSGLMYYYARVLECSQKVLEEGDELSKKLYELLDCDAAINAYLRSARFGYIYNMGEALDYPRINDMWNSYIALLGKVLASTDGDMLPFGEEIEAVTKKLLSLSPAELNSFLSSVNFLYETSGGMVKALDYTSSPINMLTYVMAVYFEEVLPESITPLFKHLLLAAESLSQIGLNKDALTEYKTYMSELNGLFKNLSETDKETFKSYFEDAYNAHNALYSNVLDDGKIDFGGKEDEFDELISWFDTLDEVFYLISTTEDSAELNRLVPLAIAVYEKANAIFESLRDGDATVANALFTKIYTKDGTNYTLDKRYFGARNAIVSILITSGVSDAAGNSIMSWDAYAGASATLKDFIVKAVDLMLAQHNEKLYTGDLYALISGFRALEAEDQATFYLLGINVLYYEAVEANVWAMLTEANKVEGFINKALNLEIAYVMYASTGSDDALASLKSAASAVEELLTELGDGENAKEYLEPLYAEYLKAVSEM